MGFMDKVKASAKNVDSKLGQSVDESKLKSKINEEESSINKAYLELGETLYKNKKGKGTDFDAKSAEICKKIDDSLESIECYKKQIEELKEKGSKERAANSAAANAADNSKKKD